ncbi:thioredoxin-like protein [Thelephora terrestris]|uniref:Thioredoxin-like protein n=1 Tax=Thelephora terrestris TaxID=56493 RepID=A0A9P6HQZ3_9AGAM|nr:thioredoxin-like protein [Thelephora terrestris]
MAVNPNEDTEFNDALRKHGILPPKVTEPSSPSPPASPTLSDLLDDMTPVELKEIGEDTNDDELERLAETFRRQRLEEIKKASSSRFGRVYPIGRDDYTREVTEASKVTVPGDPGKGTGVICLLYKDGLPRSERTFEHVKVLAQRHPKTKFVSIVGDKCIPDLPESRQPMLVIYRDGEVQNQIVAWGGDRERRLEELEAVLVLCGAIIPTTIPRGDESAREEDSGDESEDGLKKSKYGSRGAVRRTVKSKKDDDSGSELDM